MISLIDGGPVPRNGGWAQRQEPASRIIREVSQSTYRFDRRVKLPRYAKAGIPLLWIVNLESRAIEVFSEPRGKSYASRKVFAAGKSVQLRAGELPSVIEALIPVIDVLT